MESGTTWLKLGSLAACGLVLLLISEAYRRSIAPMRQREAAALLDVRNLSERVADAQKTMAVIRAREMDTERIRGENDKLQADLPSGAANVAFPAWVKERFARARIGVPRIRLNATQDEPNASGYERGFWSVALPIDEAGRDVPRLLAAVADMDRQNSFVRVLDFKLQPDPEKAGRRVGLLNLATILRK